MVWTGDGTYRLAPALLTLLNQLEHAYPDQAWQTSAQTGTIGDAAHRAEGSASDHNPWLANTVRALDVAANMPGGPNCEALFQMVNRMYAAHDPRVYPDGYAIFNYRITDWDNPGGYHAQTGDPHTEHAHISVSTNPAGYNSTAPWPLAESTLGSGTEIAQPTTAELPQEEDEMKPYLVRDLTGNIWCVRPDLSSKTLVSPGTVAALHKNVPNSYAPNPGIDQSTLARIPVAK